MNLLTNASEAIGETDGLITIRTGRLRVNATHRFLGKGLAGFIRKPYGLADLISAMRNPLAAAGTP